MIIGMCGFIGSGKSTAGDYLVKEKGWESISFAKTLKDATANIFGWERHLLEGDTNESRIFRETKDAWWSNKFGHDVTPRWVLQHLGTNVMRNHLADNIWIWATERILDNQTSNVVITDVRFQNEIAMLTNMKNSYTVWVRKGPNPDWYADALNQNQTGGNLMQSKWSNIHSSEWSWIGSHIDCEIVNDGSINDLYIKIDNFIERINQ